MPAPLSQQYQEAQVRAFFDGASEGFFVEVGVGHPTRGSQSFHLEVAGWAGVLVEPQPDLAAFLVTARNAKVFAVACTAPDLAGQDLALRVAGVEGDYVTMAPTRTLDDILDEAEAPAPFDLLSIDYAGRELDTLLGFDFARWRPRLILLADDVTSLQKRRFLRESGYQLIRHIGNNGWYVPADSDIAPDQWMIVGKYYLALPFRKLRHALRRVFGLSKRR